MADKNFEQQVAEQIKEGLKDFGVWGEISKLPADEKERIRKVLDGILASVMGGHKVVDELRKEEREVLRKQSDAPIAVSDAPHLPFFPFVIPVAARMHPADFPVLAALPRRIAPQGDKAEWIAIANVWERPGFTGSPPNVALGESPTSPAAHKTDYVRFSSPFRTLQVWKKVTFMAQAASRTFGDLLLRESINAAVALHSGEEALVINGDTSSNPNAFDGLLKVIGDGITVGTKTYAGVKKELNTDGALTLKQLSLQDIYVVAQTIVERGTAYPKLMLVHPRLVPTLAQEWWEVVRVTVAPGVPVTAPEVVAGGVSFPMMLPGVGQIQVVPCRWMPTRTITVGGNQVEVSDILLLDHDESLPGRFHGYTETGRAIEMWDLQPTQVAWFAPITLTYRIAAYKFTTLVVRAPILQGVIKNVPLLTL